MRHLLSLSAVATLVLTLLLCLSSTHAHNITRILAQHSLFSNFSHYLALTRLAPVINRRQGITVLAVDNAAMSSLLSKRLSLQTIKNILSLHVLLRYFGAKTLNQTTTGTTLTTTLLTSTTHRNTSYVNITNLKGGKVGFGPEHNDGKLTSIYVNSIEEIPHNISVLQISEVLNSSEAEAPTPAPSKLNLTAILSKRGCKAFSDLLTSSAADTTFRKNIDKGLTVFCPSNAVIKNFTPNYNHLTANQKALLLLYHGVPLYRSRQMLKSHNGTVNTLATDGAKKYNFTVQSDGKKVTLKTKVMTANLTGTLIDKKPLAVYEINKVLLPRELFEKVTKAPTPAPASSPRGKKKKEELNAPKAGSPANDAADQTGNDNGGCGLMGSARLAIGLMGLGLGAILL